MRARYLVLEYLSAQLGCRCVAIKCPTPNTDVPLEFAVQKLTMEREAPTLRCGVGDPVTSASALHCMALHRVHLGLGSQSRGRKTTHYTNIGIISWLEEPLAQQSVG